MSALPGISLEEAFALFDAEPRWKKMLWAMNRHTKAIIRSPRTALRAIRLAYQRLSRGWDDRSLWDLDRHLGRTLGPQLIEMARIAHGYPAPYPGDFDGWVRDLRTAGEALDAYGGFEWGNDDYMTVRADAKSALLWVADNFGALWD